MFLFYKEYCIGINRKPCGKTDFISKLSEIQINFYKSNGYNTYKIDLIDLKKIADKNNWINECDEFEVIPKEFLELENVQDDKNNDLENQIKDLKKHIQELKLQIEEKDLEIEILK